MNQVKFNINNETFNVWYFKGPKNGPILHWSHANGFNAPTYENLLKKLSQSCHVYAWDARAHGLSSDLKLPVGNNIYKQYVNDFVGLINVLYEKHSTPIIVAGHSFGATVCIKAEAALKGKISKLILADPVLFTPFVARVSQILRLLKFKKPKAIYLAANAEKRQNMWITKDEVFLSLSQKQLFKNWDRVSLQNYVKYGTRDTSEGVRLSCPRDIESLIFKESEHEFLFEEIINLSIQTHAYFASKGSPAFAKSAFQKSNKTKTSRIIPSTSHLFPIDEYDKFYKEILKHIL
jgi:pimeloyl-ACP methyl ester carboxylesterase